MKSETLGENILAAEVTNISSHGFWLLLDEEELYLPFSDFPWFKQAKVAQILHVEIHSPSHLYWPDLDVDLEVESIRQPEQYPLIAKD